MTSAADLDGDGAPETILIDETDGHLTITDGETVYRSRDKWRVVQACIGDTDANGLPEVVALLDSDHGRHVGLFAHFGGEYRERLVTREIHPAPVSLQVVGDLIFLTRKPTDGETGATQTILRWNGFGFTSVESASAP